MLYVYFLFEKNKEAWETNVCTAAYPTAKKLTASLSELSTQKLNDEPVRDKLHKGDMAVNSPQF